MAYKIVLSRKAQKQLEKMDETVVRIILKWLKKNIDGSDQPRAHGKPLRGNLSEYWRYRIGDYRVICTIDDGELIVLTISIENRKNAYE